ncbi:MAG: hypothetical protein ACP5SG_06300 [Dissulfurimicrobium sp.]|nr:hypothetical protein [Dissulfurimicrobium hydrothermale]
MTTDQKIIKNKLGLPDNTALASFEFFMCNHDKLFLLSMQVIL